ncbi:glutamine-hydrolyzing carbamoyl-phosphate synthase small subunit [uncultured Sphaerochaeta sp.]|uniref:glutamine-hydrolyzing carbamoyl-phosphate synthase small subunit n=1 Tax=uncultured Sphaerochaeta sp. TaxID=886478 RepID=UPI002A0A10E2|nr:glutamine-hydrolyzing carbamoyl-phosphate synthase small subunit [uncultured Sphaerochaeta sp.]
MEKTFLVLQDGSIFSGHGFGKLAPKPFELQDLPSIGEAVFNTSMTGYQEILTDPSYNGQMVVMTYPHIGNYGCEEYLNENTLCPESIPATAMIVHELYEGPLPEGKISLDAFMKKHEVFGITGIDTRSLTLHLRDQGSCNAVLVRSDVLGLKGTELKQTMAALKAFPSICDRDLIDGVSVHTVLVDPQVEIPAPSNPLYRFAVVDFGIKKSIINELYKRNIAVTLFPSTVKSKEILSSGCTALFLSNGPGDPALLTGAVLMTQEVIGKLPVFGICLGHQIITWALGGKTIKMKFGHHGANHPVKDCFTGKTFVTSQNHGFMSEIESLPPLAQPWFINANDNSIEGLVHANLPVLSVQFHPEASPGPHDGAWIFDRFISVAAQGAKV